MDLQGELGQPWNWHLLLVLWATLKFYEAGGHYITFLHEASRCTILALGQSCRAHASCGNH